MMKIPLLLLLVAVLGGAPPAIAGADDTEARNRVSFQVESGRDVRNDLMVVVMKVMVEGRKPNRVADEINQAMSWALEQARTEPRVKAESGDYRTWPVYEDKKIVRWRAQQELWLESGDAGQVSQLVGLLQSRLQVQSMQFSVSPERRQSVMDELISEALAAFRTRAEIIRKSLGANGYQLDTLSINSRGQPPVVPVRMQATAMADSAGVHQPALERGTSRVTVQVSGTVKLQFREKTGE